MRRYVEYTSFDEDVVTNTGQDKTLDDDYRWVKDSFFGKLLSALIYAVVFVVSAIYGIFFLHIKVVGREKIKKRSGKGFYVYGNHTQPVGDAILPLFLFRWRRMRAVVSPANLGIPIIGRLLPYLGALPIPKIGRMREFLSAIEHFESRGNGIVIYPEAHVWPYYTGIRPYGTAAFSYPLKSGLPSYCMTATYQKRSFGKKPRMTVYIDGPFEADATLPQSERKKELARKISRCMKERSLNSNYEYWAYEERK